MLVIFPILFCFSFFIWSCSVLMMTQIVRCESTVAQGLRSDTLQAPKRRKCASMRLSPPPLILLACWLRTSLHLNQPRTQMPLTHNWLLKSPTQSPVHKLCQMAVLPVHCDVAAGWSHNAPSFWGALSVLSVCQSGSCQELLVCSCLTRPSSKSSSETMTFVRYKVAQAALYDELVAVAINTHQALAFVALALQGPLPARTV